MRILIGPMLIIIGHQNITILYSGTILVLRNVIFEDVFGPNPQSGPGSLDQLEALENYSELCIQFIVLTSILP